MGICGSCNREIRVCDVCGGLICAPGCTDRIDDGCTCEEDEEDALDDDLDEDEE